MFTNFGVDSEDIRAVPPNMGHALADPAAVPAELAAEDAPDQSAVLEGVGFQSDFRETSADQYHSLGTHSRKLSWYRRTYETDNRGAALMSLGQKLKLEIDDDLHIPITDDNLVIKAGHVSLDFECIVSRHFFDGVLPTSEAEFDWVLSFELNQCFRPWDQRTAMLGVDAAGRMLNIGFSGESQYWLLMCPDDALEPGYEPVAAGLNTGPSRMAPADWLRVVAFFAHCLCRLKIDDTTATNLYPDVSSREAFARSTNILYVFVRRYSFDFRLTHERPSSLAFANIAN